MKQTKIFKLDEGDFRVWSSTKQELNNPANPFSNTYIEDKKEELKCLMSRFMSQYEVRCN